MDNKKLLISKINKKEFVDVPASIPEIRISLDVVGIRKRPHYIIVLDPFTKSPVRLMSEIKVFLNLPANQRGLHMSRIEKSLYKMEKDKPYTLLSYARKLCRDIKETQGQENCRVEIVADYEYLVKKDFSQQPRYELLKLYVSCEYNGKQSDVSIGMHVPFINACPCTQRWAMRDFYKELEKHNYKRKEILSLLQKAPLQAHTNRGNASLVVHSDKVSFVDLYAILEDSVTIISELLSGEDEHLAVRSAHHQGMFCEDVIRSIIKNVVVSLNKIISPQTLIEIAVDVDESIHFHNLYSEVRDSLKNLRTKYKKGH
ncbi:GTP cyclohydrolase I FolE2 [bacterium]|nr:GTP cyclohydrolase I FolE2 [bacterium]